MVQRCSRSTLPWPTSRDASGSSARSSADFGDRFLVDGADAVAADYIVARLAAPPSALVVVDYLKLLDQRRDSPSVMEQVGSLKRFAREVTRSSSAFADGWQLRCGGQPFPGWRTFARRTRWT